MAQVITVKGALPPDQLGFTHAHEHVFIDLLCWLDPNADKKLLDVPVTIDILADLKRKDGQCKDNMILSSFEDARKELERYKQFGGRSLVEVTPHGTGRDVKNLRRVSEATGVNIVCGTGWYVDSTHPLIVKHKSSAELADLMIRELCEGIDGTDICAGVIGEIGCSEPLTPSEEKVLSAAAKAQLSTNAPLTLHPATFDPARRALSRRIERYLEILRKNDANMNRIYVSHMDSYSNDTDYQERILGDYEVTLSYDGFGQEQYYDNIFWGAGGMTDKERISALTTLLRKGLERRIVLSCDICLKTHLRKYGGWGYSHVIEHIIPELIQNGISPRQIDEMMAENPRRLFSR